MWAPFYEYIMQNHREFLILETRKIIDILRNWGTNIIVPGNVNALTRLYQLVEEAKEKYGMDIEELQKELDNYETLPR